MIAGLAAAIALTSASANPRAKLGTSLQCDIAIQTAKAIIDNRGGKPVVFDDADESSMIVGGSAKSLATSWSRYENGKEIPVPNPPLSLAEDFFKSGGQNALPACSSMARMLRQRHVRFGPREVRSVVAHANRDDEYPAYIYAVGLPVISKDGALALLYESNAEGGLAGGARVDMLKKQPDGTWKVIATQGLWIS
jgi:hypothetical protein